MPNIFKIIQDYRRAASMLVMVMIVLLLPYLAGATSISPKKTAEVSKKTAEVSKKATDVSKKAAAPKTNGTATAKKNESPAAKPEIKKVAATASKPAPNTKITAAIAKKTVATASNSLNSKTKKMATAPTPLASKGKITASRPRVRTMVENDIPFREEVQKYIGTPYVRGGTGGSGIDCSGLSKRFYAEVFGIELPHSSHDQSLLSALEQVPASVDSLQPSDLLFFSNTKKNTINHVGIYLSDGKFMHATPGRGVVISDLDETPYYRKHLVSSKRFKGSILSKLDPDLFGSEDDGAASQNIGLGYATSDRKPVSVKVETFYDRDLSATDNGHGAASGESGMAIPANVESWKGMRASADFHPVGAMRITPSVSVMDGETLASRDNQHWKAYGMEAAIVPRGSAWSLALSMHSLFNETYYKAYPGVENGTDMGLRFNYQVSDAIRFSVNSTWDNMTPRENNAYADDPEINQNISFNLGFSF